MLEMLSEHRRSRLREATTLTCPVEPTDDAPRTDVKLDVDLVTTHSAAMGSTVRTAAGIFTLVVRLGVVLQDVVFVGHLLRWFKHNESGKEYDHDQQQRSTTKKVASSQG
jgi:hypothetical protein